MSSVTPACVADVTINPKGLTILLQSAFWETHRSIIGFRLRPKELPMLSFSRARARHYGKSRHGNIRLVPNPVIGG